MGAAVLAFPGVRSVRSTAAARPNVIIVLSDDQGYGDFSCHGNPVLKTPNLDALHDRSVRLTDFHVAPVCTPTRSQLMTGLDALHNRACCVPSGRNLMRRDIPTMAGIFKSGGYRTGLFGKWHLGDAYPDRPMDRGFDKAVWFHGYGLQSEIEFDNDYVNPRYLDGTRVKQADGYCTDFWFGEAIRWMEECRRKKEPFFVYLPTNVPHGPLWAEEKYAALYREKVDTPTADFFGMIANLDDNIGRLEAWLMRSGLRENTIVIFMNDNGGTVGMKTWNAGLREGKGSHYEGGHRAACFIRWPVGGFGQPRDVTVPAQIQDLLPTLMDLCGLTGPGGAAFDGLSLVPLLRNQGPFPDRMFMVHYGGRIRPVKYEGCLIWNQWRLLKGEELYDIRTDLAQTRNLANQYPDVLARMKAFEDQWWSEIEPGLNEFIPMVVGSPVSNPVLLTSNNWQEVDVDNHRRVGEAAGGPRGGPWNIQVERDGEYRIELRRWPFHTDCPIGSEGPRQTVSGRPLSYSVKKISAAGARLIIDGKEHSTGVKPQDLGAVFRCRLAAGRHIMQGWFRDARNEDLCGAFYAMVTRI